MRLLLRRAAGKLHKRNMAAAFGRWKEMWLEVVKMRDLMNKVIRRIARQKMFGAWKKWCDYMDEIYDARGADGDSEAGAYTRPLFGST